MMFSCGMSVGNFGQIIAQIALARKSFRPLFRRPENIFAKAPAFSQPPNHIKISAGIFLPLSTRLKEHT
ncbi:hypothetical protein BWD09_01295 [Neisseria dentiae]|uniref:Uncharacterized protein n=1 Tax=Neisseria dentiae TaxID=194197 RepID=A0A1X3DF98_9NEIS|nr:hypothetical protein BWD09_01295 [Neisseria dentiae]